MKPSHFAARITTAQKTPTLSMCWDHSQRLFVLHNVKPFLLETPLLKVESRAIHFFAVMEVNSFNARFKHLIPFHIACTSAAKLHASCVVLGFCVGHNNCRMSCNGPPKRWCV